MSLFEDAEGLTLEIRPERYWRGWHGRLAPLIFLTFLWIIVPLPILGGILGVAGLLGGLAAGLAIFGLIWLLASTWRLRLSQSGDFLLYTRRPDSPKWVGRAYQLKIWTVPALIHGAHRGTVVTLVYSHPSRRANQSREFYLLSGSDVSALLEVTRFGVEHIKVN